MNEIIKLPNIEAVQKLANTSIDDKNYTIK